MVLAACGSSAKTATSGTTARPATASTLPALDDAKLQTILRHWLARADAPGAIVGIQIGDQAPKILAQGEADRRTHTVLHAEDAFRIGSVTKAFVGEVALALSRRKELDLDDTIKRWFPSFPHADQIRVRDLMTHRSGLPPIGVEAGPATYADSWGKLIAAHLTHRFTPAEVIAYARDHPLLSPPGAATHYSNMNLILLGEIIAAVTGDDIAHALRAEVIDPFGLTSTYFAATEPRSPAPVAGIQHLTPDAPAVDMDAVPETGLVTALGASAAMVSNAPDLVAWSNQYFRALGRGSSDLRKSVFAINKDGTGLGALGFAKDGFCLFNQGGCKPDSEFLGVGADGAVPGGSAQVMYDPSNDVTVVTLANSDTVNLEDLTVRSYYLAIAGTQRYEEAFESTTTTTTQRP